MVRPGIFIYGGEAGPRVQPEAVASVRARVGLVRRVPADTELGYGATYRVRRDEVWGTLAIGYGDGFPPAPPGPRGRRGAGSWAARANHRPHLHGHDGGGPDGSRRCPSGRCGHPDRHRWRRRDPSRRGRSPLRYHLIRNSDRVRSSPSAHISGRGGGSLTRQVEPSSAALRPSRATPRRHRRYGFLLPSSRSRSMRRHAAQRRQRITPARTCGRGALIGIPILLLTANPDTASRRGTGLTSDSRANLEVP